MRWLGRHGKQFVWGWWRYDCRTPAHANGLGRKNGARHGNFSHFAHIVIFVYFVCNSRFLSAERTFAHGNRRDGGWRGWRVAFGKIAHQNRQFDFCAFTARGRRVFVFRVGEKTVR